MAIPNTTYSGPKADRILPYVAYSTGSGETNGALHIFGDSCSPRMALLCAGFPDDQTIFLSFGKALGEQGILVGIMCLPGYDDRPQDGMPWEGHPRGGFSFDETAQAVREASKVLKDFSSYPKIPEFTGIFHDWGVLSGTLWATRIEQEANDDINLFRPNKIIFLDVLFDPSPKMPNLISKTAVSSLTLHQSLCFLYQVVLATCSVIQQYISRNLAAAIGYVGMYLIFATGIHPMDATDFQSRSEIYGDREPGILRCMSMTYMYRNMFAHLFSISHRFYMFSGATKTGAYLPWSLHQDWKTTPILYLYGKEKNTMFHSHLSLAMLEREETEKRSLSRAVGIEGAGHWLFIQKHEECLKHVLAFIRAENTFI